MFAIDLLCVTEIAGPKEALTILIEETASFVLTSHSVLRGAMRQFEQCFDLSNSGKKHRHGRRGLSDPMSLLFRL